MRYLIPVLLLASPAAAHPNSLSHSHVAGWLVPVAMLAVVAASIAVQRRAIRVKT